MKDVEQVIEQMKLLLAEWCKPSLIQPKSHGFETHVPFVSFEVARRSVQNGVNQTVVRVHVRHDPFGYAKHSTERVYNDVEHVSKETLESQLLHSLTWNGSPYYLFLSSSKKKGGRQFRKRTEIMG